MDHFRYLLDHAEADVSELENKLRFVYGNEIKNKDIHEANEALRRIITKDGIGVAVLVAWLHGLEIGHIPLALSPAPESSANPGVRVIGADGACPYRFVHVPVRQFRRNTAKLVELGILSQNADPARLVYHEDGLVGTFSFQKPGSVNLTGQDIQDILRALAQQGVLVPADVDNNRQIQFKDPAAKRRILDLKTDIYVRVAHRSLDRTHIVLPPGCNREEVWDYVMETLQFRFACNYCSVQVLSPREVTINSAHASAALDGQEDELATVRNYQLGFTFSPVGDPKDVCHFLAWDFPRIDDLVMNMEPQAYSFSDLIRMVRVINHDIAEFCRKNDIDEAPRSISGGCNHWAGNSIYHQHYQFFRVADLPLMIAASAGAELLAEHQGVQVLRVSRPWPAPGFLIRSTQPGGEETLRKVADRVAREWRVLNHGEDWSYGNEIAVQNHTQNIFVTTDRAQLSAVFIPRHRSRVSTGSKDVIRKTNAGVLEMMGYFVVDDPADFAKLCDMTPTERRSLGDSWLTQLSPDASTVAEFEMNVRICLSTAVTPFVERIEDLLKYPLDGSKQRAQSIAGDIQRDGQLQPSQREHLYRELVWAVLETTSNGPLRRSAQ